MIVQRLLPALLVAILAGAFIFFIAFGTTEEQGGGIGPYAASLAALIGIAVFVILFLGIETLAERRDVTRRVQILRGQRSQVRGAKQRKSIHKDRIINQSSQLRRKLTSGATKFMGVSGDKMPELRLLLLQAGFIGDRALINFLIAKTVMPFIGLAAGIMLGFWLLQGNFNISLSAVLDAPLNSQIEFAAACLGGGLVGSMSIESYLKSRAKKRQQAIWEDIPDTIDLMVIYTETGQTLDTALPRIIDEIRENCEDLALELQILRTELRLQTERASAYDNLVKRVEINAVKSFTSIIKQSERMGTPVSVGLNQLSGELRRERMLLAERRAARIPVLITFPLMLCIMPAMFIVVLGPTIIRMGDLMGSMGI